MLKFPGESREIFLEPGKYLVAMDFPFAKANPARKPRGAAGS
jgi:hypothetical protein